MTYSGAISRDKRKRTRPKVTSLACRSLRYGLAVGIGWIRLTTSPALALVTGATLLAQSDTQVYCNTVATPWDCGNIAGTVTLHQLSHKVPKKAVKEYERATKAQSQGDRDTAIEHLSKAVAIDPQFWEALNNLGVNLTLANRIDLAIEQLEKAIAVDPHAPVAYANLSVAFLRQRRFADAEQAARQNAAIDPLGTSGPFILGTSLILQHKFTLEAEESLKRASRSFPQARVPLAVLLANRGKLDSARKELHLYLASGNTSGADLANRVMHDLDSPQFMVTATRR